MGGDCAPRRSTEAGSAIVLDDGRKCVSTVYERNESRSPPAPSTTDLIGANKPPSRASKTRCFKKWIRGFTPEETIRLTIESLGMDIEEFAMLGLLPRSQFERVVAGAAPISEDIVEGMERVVGEQWPHV